jgi:serine phosphatase RsbU (regulator of sigma subunit)
MEKQKFKLRSSIQTKLLLGSFIILIGIISFLTISSIRLIKNDRITYIFEAQTTVSQLAGREFSLLLTQSVELLSEMSRATSAEQANSLLNTQSLLFYAQSGRYRDPLKEFVPSRSIGKADYLKRLNLSRQDLQPRAYLFHLVNDELMENGYAFVNLSQIGMPPLLGIFFIDRANPTSRPPVQEYSLTFGVLSLERFQTSLPPSIGEMMVTDSNGQLIFHSKAEELYASSINQVSAERRPHALDDVFEYGRAIPASLLTREMVIHDENSLVTFFKPGLNLLVMTRLNYDRAMLTVSLLMERLMTFGVFAVSFSFILAFFFSHQITTPLKRLVKAAQSVGDGNFDIQLPVQSRDETGALSSAFNQMSEKISELVKKMLEQVKLEHEVAVASSVQANLIPPPRYEDDLVELESFYQSADQCGGDWWEYFQIRDYGFIIIADATGHGIPSALMTAAIKGGFSALHKVLDQEKSTLAISPSQILSIVNSSVFEAGNAEIQMTAFLGIIDFKAKTLSYASAGHNPPWFAQKTENSPHKILSLISKSARLGEKSEISLPADITIPLAADDRILLYTDGWIEGENVQEEFYGKKRARKQLEKVLQSNPKPFLPELMKDFFLFVGDQSFKDDVTIVSLKVKTTL